MFDETKGPGRVFFHPEDSLELKWVAYQPLANHVNNVKFLLENWQTNNQISDLAIPEDRRKTLVKGAKNHDWGKTAKFLIKTNKTHNGWTYSYSGHRFLHPIDVDIAAQTDKEVLYNRTLENAHHDFSVQEIVKDAFSLKQAEASYQNYPKDLFVFEMCDQIEAEVAVMAIQEKSGRNASFMEYEVSLDTSSSTDSHKVFTLNPFPFEKDVDYAVVFRKDIPQERLTSSYLKQRGFEAYDNLQTIQITLKGEEEANVAVSTNHEDFYKVAPKNPYTANALQVDVWNKWFKEKQDDYLQSNVGIIVKAPTGVGKTEACVYPPLAQNKRVVLILPAKALVDDHKQRFQNVLLNLTKHNKGQRRLLIDTGDDIELYSYINGVGKESNPEKKARHLYRADIIITTLDKFLYRFFGYGGGRKSYTFPLRIGDKSRMAFIFDEAHSYEGTAFTNFQSLATTLYDNNHNITLMTATLPDAYQTALQDPDDFGFAGRWDVVDYLGKETELSNNKEQYIGRRQLYFEAEEDIIDYSSFENYDDKIDAFNLQKDLRRTKILEQIQSEWDNNKRLIVTLDRVIDATEVYEELKAKLYLDCLLEGPENAKLFLYHGRLDREWRSQVYAQVKQLNDAGNPYILVSTSAIEIGVDLDANTLITEICNPDALVQRMGRCNRQGKLSDAKVIVIGSQIPDFLDAFGDNRDKYDDYIQHLTDHHQKIIDGDFSQAAMQIFPKPVLSDPRAATAFDMLYRYIYDFELEYQNLHELGFIATRSWDPALTIRIPQGSASDATYDHVQVPVSRLSRNSDDAYDVLIEQYKMHQDKDKSWSGDWEKVTHGGDLYKGTYRITLEESSRLCQEYKKDLGLVDLPKVFQRQRWKQDPPLQVRLSTWSFEKTEDKGDVLYFAGETKADGKEKGKRMIFSYLADPVLDES